MSANPPPEEMPPRKASSPSTRSDPEGARYTPASGAPHEPGIHLAAGSLPLPDYELVRALGKGGYGEVWLARGPGGFDVALKFVRLGEQAGDVELRALELMKHIRNPHLLPMFGAWQREGWLIIAMELADRTLLDRLREVLEQGLQGIPTAELLEYMAEAARGLDYLNQCREPSGGAGAVGIQHKDVKPQNLLLVGGAVKVADFGLARLLEHTVTAATGIMTPAYAAPEFFHDQVTRWSDQYSLAVTYCQLRGGRLPFRGTPVQVMAGHQQRPPNLAMLPEAEQLVVARALSKKPEERWPSCREFVQELQAAAGRGPAVVAPGAARPTSSTASMPSVGTLSPGQAPLPRREEGLKAPPRVRAPWRERSRAWVRLVLALPLVLLLAATVIGGWFWLSGSSPHTGTSDSQTRAQRAAPVSTASRLAPEEEEAKVEYGRKLAQLEEPRRRAERAQQSILTGDLAELWRKHPQESTWLTEAVGHLGAARILFEGSACAKAVAQLDRARPLLDLPPRWQDNARQAQGLARQGQATLRERQAKLEDKPGSLWAWPEKQLTLLQGELLKGDGGKGLALAQAATQWLAQTEDIVGLRLAATQAAGQAKGAMHISALREEHAAVGADVRKADEALSQGRAEQARDLYRQTARRYGQLAVKVEKYQEQRRAPDEAPAARDEPERRPDVIYVPTPQVVVDRMLQPAHVTEDDIVYDLGCGDGRIPVTAAKKYGCRAWGFDIDPRRVEESLENVKKNKVEDLVSIAKKDIFTLDLSKATVITLYLLPSLNVKLIPQLEKLKPGSRIVSHDFDMRGVKPAKVEEVKTEEGRTKTIYLWVTPLQKEKD
jgi:serine/threonine protein kinase